MGKKRKSDASKLDEVDRTMYTTFCSAANSLSQLYTQAMNHQKFAFQAGERHAMEILYQWILRQHEEGSRVSGADLVAYLQRELDYGGEDASMLSRVQFQHQDVQPTTPHTSSASANTTCGSHGQATFHPGTKSAHSVQSRDSVFSNALSSPVRRGLQPFHIAQSGYRNNEANSSQTRGSNSASSNDTSMDMHTDSSSHERYS